VFHFGKLPSKIKQNISMGKPLQNEFSWSFSRLGTFSECQKRYWYSYYGSWEGWPKTPYDSRPSIDPLAAYLYAVKNMQHLVMFVGTVVHGAIEETLKTSMTAREKQLPTREELFARGEKIFQKGLASSRSRAWIEAPKKNTNLFEHYYSAPGAPDPITPQIEAENLEKIRRCLDNWLASPIAKMAYDGRATWLSVEELASFTLEAFKIIVVIDFAMRWNGTTIFFDWKTGKENEKTEEQLYAYALYGNRLLGIPYEKLILSPFYLADNNYTKIGGGQATTISPERMKEVEAKIVASCKVMAEKHSLVKPDPKLFPHTSNKALCRRCPFSELCMASDFQNLSYAELAGRVPEFSKASLISQA